MAGLVSLLYVSRSQLRSGDDQVGRIVADARACNARMDVTGALIFTGRHFAQILEGEAATIDRLIVRIAKDDRHGGLRIVEVVPVAERAFATWSLAYSGGMDYVDRKVRALLCGGTATDVHALRSLMEELVR